MGKFTQFGRVHPRRKRAARGQGGAARAGPQAVEQRALADVHVLFVDEGKTWPVKRVLCKDAFAYSCLAAMPDGTIGCLYEAEGTKKVVFARFTLDWLTEGKDSLEKKK